jgi:hypothetical protein
MRKPLTSLDPRCQTPQPAHHASRTSREEVLCETYRKNVCASDCQCVGGKEAIMRSRTGGGRERGSEHEKERPGACGGIMWICDGDKGTEVQQADRRGWKARTRTGRRPDLYENESDGSGLTGRSGTGEIGGGADSKSFGKVTWRRSLYEQSGTDGMGFGSRHSMVQLCE